MQHNAEIESPYICIYSSCFSLSKGIDAGTDNMDYGIDTQIYIRLLIKISQLGQMIRKGIGFLHMWLGKKQ